MTLPYSARRLGPICHRRPNRGIMAPTGRAPGIFVGQLSDLVRGSNPSALSHPHYLPFFSSLVFAVHRFRLRAVVLGAVGGSVSLLGWI